MKLTMEQAQKIMRKNNGNLNLRNKRITQLPKNLIVEGWLDLGNTKVTSIPDDLIVCGSIYLDNTPITKLPNGLTVGNWLDLSNTKVTSIPDDLVVGGLLYLVGTNINSLPKSLRVGKVVFGQQFKRSDYVQLKEGDYVPGKYLYANGVLTHIKERYSFNGYTIYVGKIKGQNIVSDGKKYIFCNAQKDK